MLYDLSFTWGHGNAFSFRISFLLDKIVLFLEVETIFLPFVSDQDVCQTNKLHYVHLLALFLCSVVDSVSAYLFNKTDLTTALLNFIYHRTRLA
jgi:hypothetical protein